MSDFSNVVAPSAPLQPPSYKDGYEPGYVDAAMIAPATTNGPEAEKKEQAGGVNYDRLKFDAVTAETGYFKLLLPPNWDRGSFRAVVCWEADSGSGGVAWGISAAVGKDGDASDHSFGTEVVVTDTLLGASKKCLTGVFSTITPSGTPASGVNEVVFKIRRIPNHSDDSLLVDAALRGVYLQWSNSKKLQQLA